MKKRRGSSTIIACFAAGLCVLSAARAQQSSEEQAQQILGAAGVKGGLIVHVGCGDGKKIAEYRLDCPPVFDGLIAANGKLHVSLKDGRSACWSP